MVAVQFFGHLNFAQQSLRIFLELDEPRQPVCQIL